MSEPPALADFLDDGYVEPGDDEGRAAFRIEDDGAAGWALRQLGRLDAEEARIHDTAAAQRQAALDFIAELDSWEAAEIETLAPSRRFFTGALGDFWRRQLEPEVEELLARGLPFDEAWAKVKAKSRKLPAGTLSAKKPAASVVVTQEEDAVAWAVEHKRWDLLNMAPASPAAAAAVLHDLGRDELVRFTPAKTALLALAEDRHVVVNGEKVPGVVIERPGVEYSATPRTP